MDQNLACVTLAPLSNYGQVKGKEIGAVDILLVEDNPSYVELTRRALREIAGDDLRIEIAGGGEQALAILLEKKAIPRLVILDIKLPKIDGLDVLRRVRSNQGTRHLPVVMLSSSASAADVEEAYRLGAYGYIVRPMSFQRYIQVLTDTIGYWLVTNLSAPAAMSRGNFS